MTDEFVFNFPPCKQAENASLEDQLNKIAEELIEVAQALVNDSSHHEMLMECMDLLQTVEGLVRKVQIPFYDYDDDSEFGDVNTAKRAVIEKNRARGYYNEPEGESYPVDKLHHVKVSSNDVNIHNIVTLMMMSCSAYDYCNDDIRTIDAKVIEGHLITHAPKLVNVEVLP